MQLKWHQVLVHVLIDRFRLSFQVQSPHGLAPQLVQGQVIRLPDGQLAQVIYLDQCILS